MHIINNNVREYTTQRPYLKGTNRTFYMSDGNFNRSLLPSTPIASGIKMGKQQMKAKAISVFRETIKEKFPTLTDGELQDIISDFSSKL